MINKGFVLILCCLSIVFIAFVSATNHTSVNATRTASLQDIKEITEQGRLDYLGEQWKDFFLKNKVIMQINESLNKINFIFILLFSRNYTFSLEMLLAFMLWLFTLLSFPGYLFFINNDWYKTVATFAGVIMLAHLQIFNSLSKAAVKIMFFKSSGLWHLLTFIFLIFALVIYLYLNKYFTGILKKAREANKNRGLEHKVKKIERYQEAVKEASKI